MFWAPSHSNSRTRTRSGFLHDLCGFCRQMPLTPGHLTNLVGRARLQGPERESPCLRHRGANGNRGAFMLVPPWKSGASAPRKSFEITSGFSPWREAKRTHPSSAPLQVSPVFLECASQSSDKARDRRTTRNGSQVSLQTLRRRFSPQ